MMIALSGPSTLSDSKRDNLEHNLITSVSLIVETCFCTGLGDSRSNKVSQFSADIELVSVVDYDV